VFQVFQEILESRVKRSESKFSLPEFSSGAFVTNSSHPKPWTQLAHGPIISQHKDVQTMLTHNIMYWLQQEALTYPFTILLSSSTLFSVRTGHWKEYLTCLYSWFGRTKFLYLWCMILHFCNNALLNRVWGFNQSISSICILVYLYVSMLFFCFG